MTDDQVFCLSDDAENAHIAAEALFDIVMSELVPVLPATAEILHVGATAVRGCLTKGDLDIAVRIDHVDFRLADERVAALFARNTGSVRTEAFAAFEDKSRSPHLGIQLTSKGGQFDIFHLFVKALRDDPALVRQYNKLKTDFNSKPMSEYRIAKDFFIRVALHSQKPDL